MRPRLREGVTLSAREGGARLHDPLLDRTLALDELGGAIARACDGSRDLAAITAACDASAEEVERTVRVLLLCHLLEGAGDGTEERVAALLDGRATLRPSFLPETRFGCQSSGDCCQSFALGPLTDDDIARLAALPLERHFPAAAKGFFEEREGGARYLRSVPSPAGACLFLDGARCGVHARFGAEAKPAMCRLFPYEALATIAGYRLWDRGACARFAESRTTGPSLSSELPRVLAALPDEPDLFHPFVAVGELAVDYAHLLALSDALCEVCLVPVGGAAPVLAAARLAARFARALAETPIAAGEPDRTVARALQIASPDDALFAPAAPTEAGYRALADLLAALARLGVGGLASPLGSGPSPTADPPRALPLAVRRGGELSHVLHLVDEEVAHRLGGPAPLVRPTPLPAALDEALRGALRQQLYGYRLLIEERLDAGLLRLAMVQAVARWATRLHANGDPAPSLAQLSAGHTLATRALFGRSAAAIFRAHDGAASAIVEAIAAVA